MYADYTIRALWVGTVVPNPPGSGCAQIHWIGCTGEESLLVRLQTARAAAPAGEAMCLLLQAPEEKAAF